MFDTMGKAGKKMMCDSLWALALICAIALSATQAEEAPSSSQPVKVVAPNRLDVPTSGITARLALYLSADWSKPRPEVTRAVIVFHGILRNADVYFASGVMARYAAGPDAESSLIIAPQFLTDLDAKAHGLSADTLVWKREGWSGGANAIAPAAISSFTAIDAILAKLANNTLFPKLAQVVLAGHSGGGQVVQRYAVVGKGESALIARGVRIRYVVANPSSYVYFTPERPDSNGRLAPFADVLTCPTYNDWKYGFAGGTPDYLDQTIQAYETNYAVRDVVYLLGAKDTDPNHPLLDKTCMGEAEGPSRYVRGHWYFALMKARLGARFAHQLHDIQGVGHNNRKMFESACGLSALFNAAGCPKD
jgi:pimeloyl-ACP methyl ester carboxylesterase